MTATLQFHVVDHAPGRGLDPLQRWRRAARPYLGRMQQSATLWMLAMALGTLLLGVLVQAGVRLEQRALLQQRLGPVLAELAQQLEAGMALGQRLAPGSPLQAPLDQALAQSRSLDAIAVLTPTGNVLMRAGAEWPETPSEMVAVPLFDAAGQPIGQLRAQALAQARAQASPAGPDSMVLPGTVWLALALPLLALLLARRAAGLRRAVARRWGLAFAVLALAAGVLLAAGAGRLQGAQQQAAAEPARRAALVLAAHLSHALEAGVPLQHLSGLNPMLRQRLRDSPGVAEISVLDADQSLLAIQAGPLLADPQVPGDVAAVLYRGERVAEVRVRRAALRTPWMVLNLLGVAAALVAVGLLLIAHELRRQMPARRPLAEPAAGVLIGAALALTGAVLLRSDAALALAALAGPALLLLAACVVWRWGRAMAGPRLLSGALIAAAWCLVQG